MKYNKRGYYGMTEKGMVGLTKKETSRGSVYFENKEGEIVAKRCDTCEIDGALEEFNRDAGSVGGRRGTCRKCQKEDNRRYYAENKARLRAVRRRYYAENKDYFQKYHEERSECQEYKERRREASRRFYIENKENKEFRDLKKSIDRRYQHRRRARKRLLPDTLTADQKAGMKERFNNGCALTGDTSDLHLDHVIPLSIGHGGTTLENVIPLRGDLNNSKSATNIFEWFECAEERYNLDRNRFNDAIEYLADLNDMTPSEYRDYVYRCHDNPRHIDVEEGVEEGVEDIE